MYNEWGEYGEKNLENLTTDYQEVLDNIDEEIRLNLMSTLRGCSNIRAIKRIIKDVLNLSAIKNVWRWEEIGAVYSNPIVSTYPCNPPFPATNLAYIPSFSMTSL